MHGGEIDIDGLTADHPGGTDTGGVLTGARVHHGIDDDLDGVLVRQQVDERCEILLSPFALVHLREGPLDSIGPEFRISKLGQLFENFYNSGCRNLGHGGRRAEEEEEEEEEEEARA